MATQLRFDVTALDQASRTFLRVADTVERLERRLDKLDGKQVDVEVEVKTDTDNAEREVGAFATNARRKIEAALASIPDLELGADATPAERTVAGLRSELETLSSKRIGIDIPADEAIREARRIQAALDDVARDRTASVQVRADAAKASAELAKVYAEQERVDGKKATVKVDVDRSLGDSLIQVARLGAALQSIGLPAAALAAAPTIAAIGSAAVTTSGSLLLIPAAGLAGATAVGALALGFKGFGDAVGDNPKKAAEGLQQLAPAARETAVATRELAPAWREVQQSVQQTLFTGVARDLRELSGAYLPATSSALTGVAQGFNAAALSTAEFLKAPPKVAELSRALDLSRQAVTNASGALRPFAQLLTDVAAVGAQRLPALGTGFANAATRAAEFVARARETGQLGAWIDQGVAALGRIISIAGNAGSALLGVFRASRAAGADFLATVDQLTERLAALVNSARGQEALVALFRDISAGVQAAIPGVEQLVGAIGRVVAALGNAGVLQAAGAAFSAIAAQAAPVVQILGALAPVVAALLSAIGGLAPVLVPVAAGLAGIAAAGKLMTVFQAAQGHISGFVGQIRAAGGALPGFRVALSGIVSMAGGPLGIALGAAGVALTLLAQHHADAQAKAEAQRAALDGLRSTLDQYTGAVTAATVSERASQLAKDGTLAKVKELGVSTQDYVRASLGEAGALERVNGQLQAHTAGIIGATNEYKTIAPHLDAVGISLDDLAAAANGNQDAYLRVAQNLQKVGDPYLRADLGMTIGRLYELGDGSRKLAADLGITSGEFQKIQEQTRLAAEATNDFGSKLEFLKPGLAGIKDGVAPTEQMRTGLQGLSTSAGEAAKRAGDLAAATGGVEAGATAAGKAMGESREAFVKAAEGALGSRQAAEDLANQIGLIPAAAETNFRSNATGVAAEMTTLGEQIRAVPEGKDVHVQAITAEAEANLTAMGFKVERLKDGTINVTANTDAARASLDAFTRGAADKKADVQIGANRAPADQSLGAVLAAIQSGQGTVMINGNPVPANQALAFVMGAIGTAQGNVQIGAISAPAQTVLQAYLAAVNAGSGTVMINGQPKPAQDVLAALVAQTAGTTATMPIAGNPAPFNGQVIAGVAFANGSRGTITIDGNPTVANGKISSAVTFANGSKGTITIDGNQSPANGKINATVTYANGSRGTIQVDANDAAARAAIAALQRTTHSSHIITVYTQGGGGSGFVGGHVGPTGVGGTRLNAVGGYFTAAAYAGGGYRPVRMMSSARAEIVPAQQPRLIGDRMVGDEAFIPVNQSVRSLSILARTALAMGRVAVPREVLAALVAARSASAVQRPGAGGVPGGIGAITERINLGTDPVALLGTVRAAQAASTAAMWAVGARQAAAIAGLRGELGALRGEMAAVAAAVREARPITVLDQSGDPTETARSTQLQLRIG